VPLATYYQVLVNADGGSARGQALAFGKSGAMLAIGDYSSPAAGKCVMCAATQGSTNDGAVFIRGRPISIDGARKKKSPGDSHRRG
jgi:hypothetical protein